MSLTVDIQEQNKIKEIEQRINELGENKKLDELQDFPFSSFQKVITSFKNGSLKLLADNSSVVWNIIAISKEKVIFSILTILPYLVIIANIVLALVSHNWFFLIGVPVSLLGLVFASPHNPLLLPVRIIGFIAIIISFFFLDTFWTCMFLSLWLVQLINIRQRNYFNKVILSRALRSEILFCYLISKDKIFYSF